MALQLEDLELQRLFHVSCGYEMIWCIQLQLYLEPFLAFAEGAVPTRASTGISPLEEVVAIRVG